MIGDPEKGTANQLGKTCLETEPTDTNGLNVCANNVIKLIDELAIEYDFIAIQEAAKWDEIRKASNRLKIMGCVHHTIGSSNLVTFYNKEKYIAIAVNIGTFSKDDKKGRPYHIIYLQNKISKEPYIFINLHNAKELPIDELQKQLSENYYNFITISDVYFRDANKKKNYYPIDWICDKYNVIVAGDFNDKGLNYWSELKPFNDKPFYDSNKEISIKFKDFVVKTN
jgi:hypothetical protein